MNLSNLGKVKEESQNFEISISLMGGYGLLISKTRMFMYQLSLLTLSPWVTQQHLGFIVAMPKDSRQVKQLSLKLAFTDVCARTLPL